MQPNASLMERNTRIMLFCPSQLTLAFTVAASTERRSARSRSALHHPRSDVWQNASPSSAAPCTPADWVAPMVIMSPLSWREVLLRNPLKSHTSERGRSLWWKLVTKNRQVKQSIVSHWICLRIGRRSLLRRIDLSTVNQTLPYYRLQLCHSIDSPLVGLIRVSHRAFLFPSTQ